MYGNIKGAVVALFTWCTKIEPLNRTFDLDQKNKNRRRINFGKHRNRDWHIRCSVPLAGCAFSRCKWTMDKAGVAVGLATISVVGTALSFSAEHVLHGPMDFIE